MPTNLGTLIRAQEAENARASTHTVSENGASSGKFTEDMANLGGGLVSGVAGLPADIAEIGRALDPKRVVTDLIMAGARQQGLLDPINTELAQSMPSTFSDYGPPPPQEVPFTTDWWGQRLGVDTESTEFQIGAIGAPDPRDFAKIAIGAIGSLAGARRAPEIMRARLDRAKELLAEDLDDSRAFLETGWFFDPGDAKWKFEIPDTGATINWSVFDKRPSTGSLRVGDILYHPDLYELYPEIKNITLDYSLIPRNPMGIREGRQLGNEIFVEADRELFLPTLIHEVNHFIQDVENFGRGGTPFVNFPMGESRTAQQGVEVFQRNRARVGEQLAAIQASAQYRQIIEAIPKGKRWDFGARVDAFAQAGIDRPDLDLVDDMVGALEDPDLAARLEWMMPFKESFLLRRHDFYERVNRQLTIDQMPTEGDALLSANERVESTFRNAWNKEYKSLTGEANARLAEYRLARALERGSRSSEYLRNTHPLDDRTDMLLEERINPRNLSTFNVTYTDDAESLAHWKEEGNRVREEITQIREALNASTKPTE